MSAPSRHFHYRNFIITTSWSAPVFYIGTQILVGTPLGLLTYPIGYSIKISPAGRNDNKISCIKARKLFGRFISTSSGFFCIANQYKIIRNFIPQSTRRLSENRKPTAEKPILASISDHFRYTRKPLTEMINKTDSKWVPLTTVSILGQPPRVN